MSSITSPSGPLGSPVGVVLAVIDRDGRDLRRGDLESEKYCLQIGGAIAAAQLDDGDALALSRCRPGKSYSAASCGRRERCRRRRRGVPMHIAVRRRAAEMRPCLGPVVEAEDGFDDAVQFVGQMDRSGPAAVRPAVMLELLQVDAECLVELGDRAGENDGRGAPGPPATTARPCVFGEFLDRGHVGRMRRRTAWRSPRVSDAGRACRPP